MLGSRAGTTLLAVALSLVVTGACGSADVPLPNYSGTKAPVASTFFWFSSVEVGVCYAPNSRLPSVKGSIHCTHQEDYDVVNNTWELPQTCVALRPLGSPLNSAIIDTCTSVGGTFNTVKPTSANTDGTSAENAIASTKGQPTSTASTDDTDGTDTDGSSDKKESSLMSKLTMGLVS